MNTNYVSIKLYSDHASSTKMSFLTELITYTYFILWISKLL